MTYFKLWVVGILSIIPIILAACYLLTIDLTQKNPSGWGCFIFYLTMFIKLIQTEIILNKEEKAARDTKAKKLMTKEQGFIILVAFLSVFISQLFLKPWIMKTPQSFDKLILMIFLIIFMGESNVRAWKKYRCDRERMNNPND